jgi:undecaprenyl-diphosphatase
MSVFVAMLLGLLQGATVFLPISYSGHQTLFLNILKIEAPASGLFSFLMNLSTFVSIWLVYRRELGQLLREGIDFLRGRAYENPMNEGRLSPSIRLIFFIIVGTLPLILSVPISKRIDVLFQSGIFVGFAMIATGLLLFASDKLIKTGKKSEKTMSAKDALFIGLGQALATIPGLSRIGTVVVIGQTRGLGKDFSVRFAVFLSLPSVLVSVVAAFFSLFKGGTDWTSFFVYLVAFIISVLTGYIALQMLRLMVRRRKLRNFSYYIWAVGVIIIILSFIL